MRADIADHDRIAQSLRESFEGTEAEAQAMLAQLSLPIIELFPNLRRAMSLVVFQHQALSDSFRGALEAIEADDPNSLQNAIAALSSPLPYGDSDTPEKPHPRPASQGLH